MQNKLKYLFTAEYKDGSLYEQNEEDRSITEPDKRSCFYDVDHDKLVGFVIKGNGHTYGVDLRDGHFEVDGMPFFMHEVNDGVGHHIEKLPNGRAVAIELKDFRLIYFRRHTHQIEQSVHTGDHKEISHEIVFRVGWQCEVKCNNKDCWTFKNGLTHNYQQVMQIS